MRWLAFHLATALSSMGLPDSGELLGDLARSLPLVHGTAGFDPDAKHPEWSPRACFRSPIGNHGLLGPFQTKERAELRLENLPPHDCLLIRVDVVILCHWDGVWKSFGPDTWQASLDGGTRLFETTFSNFAGALQNFPDETGPSVHDARAGSSSHGDLGWTLDMGPDREVWKDLDTTYQIWMAVQHHRPSATFGFSGTFHDDPDPAELKGEFWAIRSCEVRVVPGDFRPSEPMVRVAAGEAFDANGRPDPAALAILVMAGVKGFPVIEKTLEKNGQKSLTRPFLLEARTDALAEADDLLGKLASEDPGIREEAFVHLENPSPRILDTMRKARDASVFPDVRTRLDAALEKPRPPQAEADEDIEPEPAAVLTGRLSHVLRLIRDPKASRWNALLKFLEK